MTHVIGSSSAPPYHRNSTPTGVQSEGQAMNFRIHVRKHDDVFEAWAPGVHGCKAVGATEEAAIEHLREALKAEFNGSGPANGNVGDAVEHVIEVDVEHAAPAPTADPEARDYVRERIKLSLQFGIVLLLLGITGIVFAFMGGKYASAPFVLFAPMITAGLGVLGIVMSIAGKGAMGKQS